MGKLPLGKLADNIALIILVTGLLTIGPRFGGALNEAAEQFSAAFDRKISPAEFVAEMRKKNQYIMGIGHRVKSLENPDARVKIVKEFEFKFVLFIIQNPKASFSLLDRSNISVWPKLDVLMLGFFLIELLYRFLFFIPPFCYRMIGTC